jgi:3-hydroxybutyryl-CoA dehydrogenase
MEAVIGVVGAGRMGRGIALSYAYSGQRVALIDLKARSTSEWQQMVVTGKAELRADLNFLASVNLLNEGEVERILNLISDHHRGDASTVLGQCPIIYEGVPEVMSAKEAVFAFVSEVAPNNTVIASTTSTFLVTELAKFVRSSERFMNAHWLNPAHLMPLVEISKSEQTSTEAVTQLRTSLEAIGKKTVVCNASPGYIVPRIQALAMNEAARLLEEGVASAEDIDRAIHYGFGPRFAILGLLEFIDWGGGDILYHASNYLSKAVDTRYQAPEIVVENMQQGRNGLRDGVGFFDYSEVDTGAYRKRRLGEFVALMKHLDLLPKRPASEADEPRSA